MPRFWNSVKAGLERHFLCAQIIFTIGLLPYLWICDKVNWALPRRWPLLGNARHMVVCTVSIPLFAIIAGSILKAAFVVEYYWIWLLCSSFIPSHQFTVSAAGMGLSVGHWAGDASCMLREFVHVAIALSKACYHFWNAGLQMLAILIAHPIVSFVIIVVYSILYRYMHSSLLVRSGEGA